jgi:formyl-CoA transferase
MVRPLDGIRVIDITSGLNGPCCGVWLSDFGADVIKIETRIDGEYGRRVLPVPDSDFTPYFTCANRGKKDITLDLNKEKAREVVYKLAERSDVLINNFRIGTLEKLGLGYGEIKKHNPNIIYAVSSGWGAKGPMAKFPSADFIAQAYGGIVSVTGTPEQPLPVGASIADLGGTFSLCLGVMTALLVRERFGIAQRVDTSLYGGQIMLQTWELDVYTMRKKLPEPLRAGRYHNTLPRRIGLQKTKDGWIMIMTRASAVLWPRLCGVLGVPELIDNPHLDPRIASYDEQLKHAAELSAVFDKAFQKKTSKEWLEIMRGIDMQVSLISTYEDVANDPQAIENGYIIEMDLPGLGPTKLAGGPVMLSETPAKAQGLPPYLGQHTEEILLELGYTLEDIAKMRENEVI